MTKEERIEDFKAECFDILKENPDLGKQFFDYWTESGPNQKKLRYEYERTFDVNKRFATWKRNHDKWNKPKEQKPTFFEQAVNKFMPNDLNQVH